MAHSVSAFLPSRSARRAPSPSAGLPAAPVATADRAAPALSLASRSLADARFSPLASSLSALRASPPPISHDDIASALRRLNRSAVFRLRRQWRLRGAGRGTLAGAIIRALEADGLIAQHPVHPHGRILSPAGMSALQRLFRF